MSLVIYGEHLSDATDEEASCVEGRGSLACDEPGCEKKYHCRSGGTDLETIQRCARRRGWGTRTLNRFGDTKDFCPAHRAEGDATGRKS